MAEKQAQKEQILQPNTFIEAYKGAYDHYVRAVLQRRQSPNATIYGNQPEIPSWTERYLGDLSRAAKMIQRK